VIPGKGATVHWSSVQFEERTMKTGFFATRLMKMALVAIVTALTGAAAAADYYKTAGNLAIYLGVLPAEMVRGHSPEHPEGKMHGGVPFAKRQHHIVVAVFDTEDGSRVTHAEVTARVGEIGLAQTKKKLERMAIDKTISYGNYFSMGSPGPYRIEIEIVRPGSTGAVKTSFEYSHPHR
jgi:hypothetical protein